MPPFDPTGTGAYVPVSRVKPITADFVGDATKGGNSNLQEFVDSRRMLKAPCRVATAAPLPAYTFLAAENKISGSVNGSINDTGIDGVTNLVVGNRVLIKSSSPMHWHENGIYVVTQVGSANLPFVLTRAADADADHEMVKGSTVWVTEGTTLAGTCWRLNFIGAFNLNVSPMNFDQVLVAGSGGTAPATPTYTLEPCKAATTAALAMTILNGVGTAVADGALVVDGVALQAGERVLVKDGNSNTVGGPSVVNGNGVYVVTAPGSTGSPFVLTRAAKPVFGDSTAIGHTVLVVDGAVNTGTEWFVSYTAPFMFSPLVAVAMGGDITNATHLGGIAAAEYAQKPHIVEYDGMFASLPTLDTRDTIALVDLTAFPTGQTLTVLLQDTAPTGTRVTVKDTKGLFDANEVEILLVGGGGAGGPMYHVGAGGGGGGGGVMVARVRLAASAEYQAITGCGGYTPTGVSGEHTSLKGGYSSIIGPNGFLLTVDGGGRGFGEDLVDAPPGGLSTLKIPGTSAALADRRGQMTGGSGGGGGVVYPDSVATAGGKGTSGGHGGTGAEASNVAYNGGGGGANGLGQFSALTGQGNGGLGARYAIRVYRNPSNELTAEFGGIYGGGGASGTPGSRGGAGGGADAPASSGQAGIAGTDATGGGGSGACVSSAFPGWQAPGKGGHGIVIISYPGKQKLSLSGGAGWHTLQLGPLCVHVLEYEPADYGSTTPTFQLDNAFRIVV